MKSRLILAITVAITAMTPVFLRPALAADVTIVGAGTVTFPVPGMGNCTSPTNLSLKTSGADFAFVGVILGGANEKTPANPCTLVNLHMEYTNRLPEQKTCSPTTPLGPITVGATGPAKLTVKGSVYTVRRDAKDCAGNVVWMINTMKVSAGTIEYHFKQYLNKALNLQAKGVLTRAPAAKI